MSESMQPKPRYNVNAEGERRAMLAHAADEFLGDGDTSMLSRAILPWRHAQVGGRRNDAHPLTASSATFGRAFVVFVTVWVAALYTFGVEGVLARRVAFYGLLLSPLFAAGCAMAVAWFVERRIDARYRRETEEAQRQRAETNLRLMVLQAQLEPHFLFNTLASLRALLRENVDQAEHLVDALVSHLRSVLPAMRADDGVSTLSDQLAICTSYLELMSIRLDGQLSFRIEVPDELMNVAVPPLMLLTLVENAIKHGIEPKPGSGSLCICAERTPGGEGISVSVMDDGIGLAAVPHKGLGLKNVREQLALRYGDHASLSLAGAMTGGTVASLCIPLERVRTS